MSEQDWISKKPVRPIHGPATLLLRGLALLVLLLLLLLDPEGRGRDLGFVDAMSVLHGHLSHFQKKSLGQLGWLQALLQEQVVLHMKVVFSGFLSRVGQVGDLRPSELRHQFRQVAHSVGLGHLVEDHHAVSLAWRVLNSQLNAAHGVAYVNERPGLTSRPVHSQGIADGGLHQEPVEHGAVVTVVIETVDESLVEHRLGSVGAPDDSLMEVGDADAIVSVVEGKEQLVLGLGHVVDGARVGRIEDLLLYALSRLGLDLDVEVALGYLHPGRAIAIDAHGAEVDQVDIEAGVDNGAQHVVRRVQVVVHRVGLVLRRLHRIGRRPLLGKVHHHVGTLRLDQIKEAGPVLGNVDVEEAYFPVGALLPRLKAHTHGLDGREGLDLQLVVDVPPGKVIDDDHVMAELGQV